jgi:hypothetical protein
LCVLVVMLGVENFKRPPVRWSRALDRNGPRCLQGDARKMHAAMGGRAAHAGPGLYEYCTILAPATDEHMQCMIFMATLCLGLGRAFCLSCRQHVFSSTALLFTWYV